MTAVAQEALVFVRDHFHERREVQRRLQMVRADFPYYPGGRRLGKRAGRIRLTHALEGLRDHVGMLFALEEADGYYFQTSCKKLPRLLPAGKKLSQSQHRRLFEQLCELAEQADRIIHHPRFVHLLESVEEKFEALDADFSAHEMAETDLMLRAFDNDADEGDVTERDGDGREVIAFDVAIFGSGVGVED